MLPLHDDNPATRRPILTIALIVLNVAVFVLLQPKGGTDEVRFAYEHALVPCEVTRGRPIEFVPVNRFSVVPTCDDLPGAAPLYAEKSPLLSVIVSMFLHASWLHLLGNMWFLWVFGNNVEDRFGHAGYALLYLGTGAIAALAQVASDPHSTNPVVGASGAIAGVMGAYLVLFPRARVLTWIPVLLFVVISLPAALVLSIWAVLQFFTESNVAWVAHVAGFLAGAGVAWPLRHRLRHPPDPPPVMNV